MSAADVQADERKRAVRALLKSPLLTASAGEVLATVRRHAGWLQEFFAENFGWLLHVERELVRLGKTPGEASDSTRSAQPSDGPSFSKRRYVVLCLALAAIERMDRQTTLQKVAEGIMSLAAGDAELIATGFVFDLASRDERRELVAVIRLLLEMGVLRRVNGDEDLFVSQRGDALYRVDRTVLARLLNSRQPPSTLAATGDKERVQALLQEYQLETEESLRRAMRHRLARQLVDDPVLYYADLSEAEREYLNRARFAVLRSILPATGLVEEARVEGIALVDPERELTDVALPEEGTDGHVALLVAELLANRLRAGDSRVARQDIEQHVQELVGVHGKYWRKSAREGGAEVWLTNQALEFLSALRLVRQHGLDIEPLPAIARFGLLPARIEGV